MFKKAELFGDTSSMAKILDTKDPRTMKTLGRKVSGFVESVWVKNREQIVFDANYYKFTQNQKLKDLILSKVGMKFVEASPYDSIWGIGYNTRDAPHNYNSWGLNLLGKALDRVLVHLLEESKPSD